MISTMQNAPLDRLGGLDTLERAVGLFIARLKATPELQPLLPDSENGDTANAEWQIQLWLTDILGGPMKYDGPDIRTLFHQPQVAPDTWARLGGLFMEAFQATGAASPVAEEARELVEAALTALTHKSASDATGTGRKPTAGQTQPGFAVAWDDEPDFPIAWRDESEAPKRAAIIAQLKAKAEELTTPVMFPDANGELWFGNAACEQALARLADWLPSDFNPAYGIPSALFFPDMVERQALFSNLNALPFKKRVFYGPDTVTLLVTAVRDEQQHILCPQISWEVSDTMAPLEVIDQPVAAPAPRAVPPKPVPAAAPTARQASASVALSVTASALKQEARAIEQSARELLTLTELLDTLAERAAGQGSGAPVESVAAAVADADGATRLVEQGLAAFEAAREVASGAGRSREVTGALDHLMELARRTNQLVLDASLRAVEDEVAGAATALMARTGAVRNGLSAQVSGLAEEAKGVSRQLERGAITAGRFAELREALSDPSAQG